MAVPRGASGLVSSLPRLVPASDLFRRLPRRCFIFQLRSGPGAGTGSHYAESARSAATNQVPGALSLVAFLDLEMGPLVPAQLSASGGDDGDLWLLVADHCIPAPAETQRHRRLARIAAGQPLCLSATLLGSEWRRAERRSFHGSGADRSGGRPRCDAPRRPTVVRDRRRALGWPVPADARRGDRGSRGDTRHRPVPPGLPAGLSVLYGHHPLSGRRRLVCWASFLAPRSEQRRRGPGARLAANVDVLHQLWRVLETHRARSGCIPENARCQFECLPSGTCHLFLLAPSEGNFRTGDRALGCSGCGSIGGGDPASSETGVEADSLHISLLCGSDHPVELSSHGSLPA